MESNGQNGQRLALRDQTFAETWEQVFPAVVDGRTCPIRWMLHRIGERWSLWVLTYLNDNGASRFSEISNNLGEPVSNRMLALTLDKLEMNALIARREDGNAVVYELTDLGVSLMTPMRSLIGWVIENAALLDKGRRKFGLPPLDLPAGVVPAPD